MSYRPIFSKATAAGESEEAQTLAGYAAAEAGLLQAEGKLVAMIGDGLNDALNPKLRER